MERIRSAIFFRRILLTVGIAFGGTAVLAQTSCLADSRTGNLATHFVISGGDIKMPVGAFLLVRKKDQLGAIRIMNVDPASTEWFGTSVYESYFQGNSSGDFVGKDVGRQTGELKLQPSKGPGRGIFIYQPGHYKARIGNWSFYFDGPGMMEMSDASFWTGVGDHGYEFAPTSACNLSEMDAHDKRLKWFRFDINASFSLPLSDLPK